MRGIRTMALASALLLAGCLEVEQTITIEADGSGSQQVRMKLRATTLQQIRQRQPAAGTGAASDPMALFEEHKVRDELVAAGLELTAHDAKGDGAWRSVELTATFGDFATLQKSPLCGSAAEWQLVDGPKPGLAKLTFYPQGKAAWQQAREKAQQMAGASDPVAEQFFRRQQEALAGLDVTVRFRLPGDVMVWTRNMERTGPREVCARIRAADIRTPQDLVRRLAPRFEVIFDASGTALFAE